MTEAVIVAGARTPIGKLSGALAGFSAMDLGGLAIAEALQRAGVAPDQVDYVLMGQVILAGQGQITARQAAVKGGIPMSVPANTINKVCLSGLNTIYLADQMIRAGDAEIVVAGGMESMTQAPHLLPGARAGFRLGDATLVDSMMYDGLTDSFDHIAMGLSTEQHNEKVGISRERQDAFAAASHEKAASAAKEGRFAEEIVPVRVPQRKGDALLVDTDEGVRPGTTAESLGALKPAFTKDGTITAGNASQISDGGAAVVVMSAEKAKDLGVTPLGQLVSYGMVAGPDNSLLTQPSRAIIKAAGKGGRGPRRRRPFRDQRGLRRRRARLHGRTRHRGGQGQRQRRRHRTRSPGRHVGHPGRAHRAARAAPARRLDRRRGALRRWRPGRCRHPARAGLAPSGRDGRARAA